MPTVFKQHSSYLSREPILMVTVKDEEHRASTLITLGGLRHIFARDKLHALRPVAEDLQVRLVSFVMTRTESLLLNPIDLKPSCAGPHRSSCCDFRHMRPLRNSHHAQTARKV